MRNSIVLASHSVDPIRSLDPSYQGFLWELYRSHYPFL